MDLLDIVVLPADAGAAKPDGRIFRVALEALGLAPNETAYVGNDAEVDVAAARAAGLRAVDVGALATLLDLPQRLGLEPGPDEESP